MEVFSSEWRTHRIKRGDECLESAEKYLNENLVNREMPSDAGRYHLDYARTLIQAAQAHYMAANVRGRA